MFFDESVMFSFTVLHDHTLSVTFFLYFYCFISSCFRFRRGSVAIHLLQAVQHHFFVFTSELFFCFFFFCTVCCRVVPVIYELLSVHGSITAIFEYNTR